MELVSSDAFPSAFSFFLGSVFCVAAAASAAAAVVVIPVIQRSTRTDNEKRRTMVVRGTALKVHFQWRPVLFFVAPGKRSGVNATGSLNGVGLLVLTPMKLQRPQQQQQQQQQQQKQQHHKSRGSSYLLLVAPTSFRWVRSFLLPPTLVSKTQFHTWTRSADAPRTHTLKRWTLFLMGYRFSPVGSQHLDR